jgi:hypothetical protein
LFFFLKKLKLSVSYKKPFFHFFIKNSFLNFFFKTLLNKKFRSFKSFSLLKNNKDLLNKNKSINLQNQRLKKKKYFFKKKKILKLFLKQQYSSSKKKKKNKKKL